MSRIAYVNGRYVPHARAAVHVEDRGYQFADGVYEVIAVENGRLIDEALHYDRLDRSLAELRIAPPISRRALRAVIREVARRNRVRNGIVYLQITRGAAPRDHQFPPDATAGVILTARSQRPKSAAQSTGVAVITTPDIRWKRTDIKSVSLLPNVLAKQAAVEAGAYETWFVDDGGYVTEGSSTNAWIVADGKEVVTRPADHSILNGVTRRSVIALAKDEGFRVTERRFTLDEAMQAKEAFLTSTTSWVMPVITLDGAKIRDGEPGPLTRALQGLYAAHCGKA